MIGAESRTIGPIVLPTTLHERVYAVARAHPEAPALVDASNRLQYGELASASAAWALILLNAGVKEQEVVAVQAGRSVDLPPALLGILSTGACYSIIDPCWPLERRIDLLNRMKVKTCIVAPQSDSEASLSSLPGLNMVPLHSATELARKRGAPPVTVSPDAPACVFWTSGSTGPPKGVLSPHRATTRLFGPETQLPGGPGAVMLSVAAAAWDGFSLELWSMLTTGGCTYMHGSTYFLPGDLRDAILQHGITDLFLTAGLFDVFVAEDVESFAGLRMVIVGGDRLSQVHASKFLDVFPEVPLINGYGPVESCVFVTTHRVRTDDLRRPEGVPIGSAVPGTEVFLVEDDEVVARGRVGEICASGQGIALGYLDDPERTLESFGAAMEGAAPNLYRTGDRGRMTDDGELLFLGRSDRQVKIAGHRIEPAEVEAAALRMGCDQAAVIPIPGDGGYRGLALFAVRGTFRGTARELRSVLATELPGPQVPWPITYLDELPLTDNGKVNHAELAEFFEEPT